MPESGGLFVIDAETGDTSQFTSVTEEGSCTFVAAAAAKNNGTYGFTVTMDGTNDVCQGLKTITAAGEVYVRMYLYVPAAFDCAGTYDNVTVLALYAGATYVCSVRLKSGATSKPYGWSLDYRYTLATYSTGWSTDAWHYVEIRYLKDGAAGGAQLWVDGTLALEDMNQATTYDITQVRVGMELEVIPNGDYLYIDDIKAATTAVGAYSALVVSIPVADRLRNGGVKFSSGAEYMRW